MPLGKRPSPILHNRHTRCIPETLPPQMSIQHLPDQPPMDFVSKSPRILTQLLDKMPSKTLMWLSHSTSLIRRGYLRGSHMQCIEAQGQPFGGGGPELAGAVLPQPRSQVVTLEYSSAEKLSKKRRRHPEPSFEKTAGQTGPFSPEASSRGSSLSQK